MSWVAMRRDGAELFGRDEGAGLPVLFQHGLGGDDAQVAEVFPAGFRRLTLECGGHGRSAARDPRARSIAGFADDALAFAAQQGIERFVVGGISMGAAIALRIAVLAPERVIGLALVRPAWSWAAAPEGLRLYDEVAGLLLDSDISRAMATFDESETARRLALEAPDNLASLRNFLTAGDRAGLADLLSAIAADGPGVTETQVRSLRVPTLVVGHRIDVVHPLALAETLAHAIGGARLVEITPKATDRARYANELRTALGAFLAGLTETDG